MEEYRKGLHHLIYLDVYMQGMTGMAVAAKLREEGDGIPLAFITTSREHALEAKKYRSILYIEKLVTVDMVAHTLSMAETVRQRRAGEVLSVADIERKKLDCPLMMSAISTC